MPAEEAPPVKNTPKFELSLDGSPVDQAVIEAIISIRARQHTDLADVLEVKLSNIDLSWTEGDTFTEGKKLSVKMGYEETEIEQVLEGDIVRRECDFPAFGGSTVTVQAFGKKFKLKKAQHSKSFTDMKDSEIVQQIASDAGLEADIDDTTEKHPYVLQAAKDHLAFIAGRAARIGYFFQIDKENKKLKFKKLAPVETPEATLKWGKDLFSFKPRFSTDAQLSKVTVSGWDMKTKQRVKHTSTPSDVKLGLGGTKAGSALAEASFGAREELCTSDPVASTKDAQMLAEAKMNTAASKYCEAEGSCQGDPKIYPGAVVEIQGTGKRCDGKYMVTSTLHLLEPRTGYITTFEAKRATEGAPEAPPAPEEPPAREESELPPQEHWVEIKVMSETGEKLAGTSYTLTKPDGSTQQGKLDDTCLIRVEGLTNPGDVKIELQPPDEMEALG